MTDKRKDKIAVAIVCIITIASIFYSIIKNKIWTEHLKDSTIVVASIDKIFITRGLIVVYVEYNYQGLNIHNSFSTYNIDSLKSHPKIRLLVSKKFPKKDIKYVGVAN